MLFCCHRNEFACEIAGKFWSMKSLLQEKLITSKPKGINRKKLVPFVLPITFTHFWEKVWTVSRCELRDRIHTSFSYQLTMQLRERKENIMGERRNLKKQSLEKLQQNLEQAEHQIEVEERRLNLAK